MITKSTKVLGVLSLALASFTATGCGDDSSGLECGVGTQDVDGTCVPLDCVEGTFPKDGQCVPVDPNDATAPATTATPPGARSRDALPSHVVLATDEFATIYFTRDGSEPTTSSPSEFSPVTVTDIQEGETIKYFAVDPAGNEEAVQSDLYSQDVEAPGPVQNFTGVVTNSDVALSWASPTDDDYQGVVLVASTDGTIGSAPEDATFYSTGDTLSTGESVLFAGDAQAAADTLATIGERHFYTAWAHDDLGNYSSGRSSENLHRALPAQAGTLSIDLVNDTVTVSTAPANLTLTGTSTYDEVGDILTLNLTVQNDAPRLLFNLKSLTTAINSGTQAGAALAGEPMSYFGPEAMDIAGSVTRTIIVVGVDGVTDPVVLDLDFVEHASLINNRNLVGTSGVIAPAVIANADTGGMRGLAISHDGRFSYAGKKNAAQLEVTDLTTNVSTATVDFEGNSSSVAGVAVGKLGNDIFAVLNKGGHYNGGNDSQFALSAGNVELLAIDPVTLEETRRMSIREGRSGMSGRGIFISPAGDRAFIPVSLNCNSSGATTCAGGSPGGVTHNELWLVDLLSFELIDTDPATEGIQPVIMGALEGTIEHCAWSPEESEFFVTFNNINIGRDFGEGDVVPPVERVNMQSFAITQLTATDAGLAGGGIVATNTKLYYASRNKDTAPGNIFTVFDLAAGTQSNPELGFTTGNSFGAAGVVIDPSRTRYYVAGSSRGNLAGDEEVAVFDIATDTRIDIDGDGANGITNIGLNSRPHGIAITPF